PNAQASGAMTNAPSGTPVLIDNIYIYYRDSFHWGPRQATGLPADLSQLTPTNFIRASMTHWLHQDGTFHHISQIPEMEMEPSPDGISFGQTTWLSYDGQNGGTIRGYETYPSQIARVLPDGSNVWYTFLQRDPLGHVTNMVGTYSMGFGVP